MKGPKWPEAREEADKKPDSIENVDSMEKVTRKLMLKTIRYLSISADKKEKMEEMLQKNTGMIGTVRTKSGSTAEKRESLESTVLCRHERDAIIAAEKIRL